MLESRISMKQGVLSVSMTVQSIVAYALERGKKCLTSDSEVRKGEFFVDRRETAEIRLSRDRCFGFPFALTELVVELGTS